MKKFTVFFTVLLGTASAMLCQGQTDSKLIMGFEKGEENGADGKPLWECKARSGNDVFWKHDYSSCNLMVRNDKASASQGEAAGIFEIFDKSVPKDKEITFAAERWQNFGWAYGKIKYLDPKNMEYGEMEGPADWNATRFYTIFSMFKNLQRMGEKKDWSGYDYLYIDAKPGQKATLRVFVEDSTNRSSYQHFEVEPGKYQTLKFDLKSAVWCSKLDLKNMGDINLLLRSFSGPGAVLFDNIRLVKEGAKSQFPIISDLSPVFDCGFYSQYRPVKEMPPVPVFVPRDRKSGKVTEQVNLAFKDIKQAVDYPTLFYISPIDSERAVLPTSDRFFRGFCFFSKDGGKTVGDINFNAGKMTDLQPEWKWGEIYTDPTTAKGWEGRCGMALNFADPQLRGNAYDTNMTWCGSAGGGSGVPFFGWVMKRVIAAKDGWIVYPKAISREERAKLPVSQDLDAVIIGDDIRGCVGWCNVTVLPTGRMWAAWKTNSKNSMYGWRVWSSLSDDLVSWRHPECGTFVGPSDYPSSDYVTLLPYGKDKVVIPTPDQDILHFFASDGKTPWKSEGKVNIGWDKMGLTVVAFADKELFAVWAEGKKDEKGGTKIKVMSLKGGVSTALDGHAATGITRNKPMSSKLCAATVCGETLYIFWLDSEKNSVNMQGFSISKRSWDKPREIWKETEGNRMAFAVAVAPNSLPNCIMLDWNSRSYTKEDALKGTNNIWVARLAVSDEHAARDTDLDGIDNESEKTFGSDPAKPDTDGDSLFDGQEAFLTMTDPKKADTDLDGDDDALELYGYSNPFDPKQMVTKSLPPIITVKATPESGKAPLKVMLDASETKDPAGLTVRTTWTLGTPGIWYQLGIAQEAQNIAVYGDRAVYTFTKPGTYTVKVHCENNRGGKADKELKITVQ